MTLADVIAEIENQRAARAAQVAAADEIRAITKYAGLRDELDYVLSLLRRVKEDKPHDT